MTQNQKIAIGLSALALGYWFYTKNKAKKSIETPQSPSAPTNTGSSKCPQGQELIQVNCKVAPCPKICADIPKSEPKRMPPRQVCEKQIDDAIKSGKTLPALPRENLIRECMKRMG